MSSRRMTDAERCLCSERLDLVAATLRHVDAELQDRGALARLLGARVPASWPPGEYDRSAQAFFRAQRVGDPTRVGWLTWNALTRHGDGTRDALVAAAGFFGPPADGAVEVGYSVVPEARGRGVATEVVGALVAFAFRHSAVDRVVAHTTDDNVASTKVLQRNGFHRVGAGAEPDSVAYVARRADR
jgi:RimJ/RimL family protein N-acetyltransferase